MIKRASLWLAATCFLSLSTWAQTNASCTFKTFQLNASDPNNPQTHPLGINSYSSVVGQATYSNSTSPKGFTRFSNGSVSYFSPAGSISAELVGRNDAGVAIGDYTQTAPGRTSFMLQGSTMTTISHPGADNAQGGTAVRGLNKYNNVVGYYFDSSEVAHGFKRFSSGAFMDIGVPGGRSTMANGINASGWIVGSFNEPNGTLHGFIYKNGSYATLDYPNTEGTELYGVSDAGVIIGLDHSTEQGRAFLYKNGKFEVITAPGAFYTHATGIAPNGLITGEYSPNGTASAGIKGFIATCQ